MNHAPDRPLEIARYGVPCRPPLWARSGHLQTLLGYAIGVPGEPLQDGSHGAESYTVDVGAGDRVYIVDAPPLTGAASSLQGVSVHLFHGLTGSTASNYMTLVAATLRRHGARVLGFNHRGQGPGQGLARALYHSGSFPDLWAAVQAGRSRYPHDRHIAVGFSLSANTALLGLTDRSLDLPPESLPDAVLAVNPPVALRACAIRIETGVNKLYDQNFVRGMRAALHERQSKGWIPASVSIPRRSSVRGADEAVTAPFAGYQNADEYYAHCSSGPRLQELRRPAIILSAADDPFIAPEDITSAATAPNPFVHIEPRGGHLGYLSSPKGERRWLAGAVLHYVQELCRPPSRRRGPSGGTRLGSNRR